MSELEELTIIDGINKCTNLLLKRDSIDVAQGSQLFLDLVVNIKQSLDYGDNQRKKTVKELLKAINEIVTFTPTSVEYNSKDIQVSRDAVKDVFFLSIISADKEKELNVFIHSNEKTSDKILYVVTEDTKSVRVFRYKFKSFKLSKCATSKMKH